MRQKISHERDKSIFLRMTALHICDDILGLVEKTVIFLRKIQCKTSYTSLLKVHNSY